MPAKAQYWRPTKTPECSITVTKKRAWRSLRPNAAIELTRLLLVSPLLPVCNGLASIILDERHLMAVSCRLAAPTPSARTRSAWKAVKDLLRPHTLRHSKAQPDG